MASSMDMIKRQTIQHMVQAYQDSSQRVELAFDLISEASDAMKAAFGEYSGIYIRETNNEIQKGLKQRAWRYIVDQTGMREVMTAKRVREFERQLESDEVPDITEDTVWQTLVSLRDNIGMLLDEAVEEIYEWLRPWNSMYKTNSEFRVGKKVVLEYCVDYQTWGDSWHVWFVHSKEGNIRSLDNVFSLLDGKGVVKYPGDLLTSIKDAIQRKEWICQTEYFDVKWFKKGTMHITMRRMDLVDKLNAIAGSGYLNKKD